MSAKILEAYIDESEIVISGRRSLLYGAAIPGDLETALEGLAQLRAQYGLASNLEIKWSSKGGDPVVKAAVKEAAIALVGSLFSCVFVVWASTDKDEAFLQMANLLRERAVDCNKSFVHLLHDQGAFRTRSAVLSALSSWADPACSLLASVESSVSPPMQFADLVTGAFSYLVRAGMGEISPRSTIFEWRPGHTEDMGLDQVFTHLLRRTIPGMMPYMDDFGPSPPEDWMRFLKYCVGKGVVVDSRFSPQELEAIRQASTFFTGCMA